MKKIVILGCENSHAKQFLTFMKDTPKYSDVEVLGVYSHETAAAEALHDEFGVKVLSSCDEITDVDGVVITARDGARHLGYARPFLNKPIAMFMDKPITVTEEDVDEFIKLKRECGIRLCGGSSLKNAEQICEVAQNAKDELEGKTIGGYVRAPLALDSEHSGFYFYGEHLVDMVLTAFGYDVKSVSAKHVANNVYVDFNYADYTVRGHYTDGNYSTYYVMRMAEKGVQNHKIDLGKTSAFRKEFDEFYELLSGAEQTKCDCEYIIPVYVMNSIMRSLDSGKTETVHPVSL